MASMSTSLLRGRMGAEVGPGRVVEDEDPSTGPEHWLTFSAAAMYGYLHGARQAAQGEQGGRQSPLLLEDHSSNELVRPSRAFAGPASHQGGGTACLLHARAGEQGATMVVGESKEQGGTHAEPTSSWPSSEVSQGVQHEAQQGARRPSGPSAAKRSQQGAFRGIGSLPMPDPFAPSEVSYPSQAAQQSGPKRS